MNEQTIRDWAVASMKPGTTPAEIAYNDALLDMMNRFATLPPMPVKSALPRPPAPPNPPPPSPAGLPGPAPAAPPAGSPVPTGSPGPTDPPAEEPIRNREAPPWHPFSRLPRGQLEQVSAQLMGAIGMCIEHRFGIPAAHLPLPAKEALINQFHVSTVAFVDEPRRRGSVAFYHAFDGGATLFGAYFIDFATGAATATYLPEGVWPQIPPQPQPKS